MYVTEDTTPRAPGPHPADVHDRDPRRAPSASASATRSATRRPTACATWSSSSRSSSRSSIPTCKVDWHGHQDRGLGVTNALWALEAGAHRVHACALGIGERVGNTPMDQLLVNLQLLGWIDRDLTRLNEYCAAVSEATGVPIPDNYPSSAATRSAPAPASTRPRSSRRARRATSGSPTASTRACPRAWSGATRSSRSGR